MLDTKSHKFQINGQECEFTYGLLSPRSHVSILAAMGNTRVLVTVNITPASPDASYFPLSIEYLEKMSASGKISGSRFRKRDGFPSDDAVLRGRMIDRSLRPRFPSDYRDEVQIIIKVISYDELSDPMVLGANAASMALLISKAPYNDPTAILRVGLNENDQPVLLSTPVSKADMMDKLPMNLIIAGDENGICNLDASVWEKNEEIVFGAMEFAHAQFGSWLNAQRDFASQFEKEDYEYLSFSPSEEAYAKIKEAYFDEIKQALISEDRDELDKALISKIKEELAEEFESSDIEYGFTKVAKKEMQRMVREDKTRVDGRGLDEVRELDSRVGILPQTHGSGLFTRGMTQVMTVATLGTMRDAQTVDDMTGESEVGYMHYYDDGPWSYGSTGRVNFMPKRRAIGHGNLGEKALYPVLPSQDDFPYTILLVSDILSEKGSSSMASSCGSSLALMDAGVPIKAPVAGIAVGIVVNENDLNDFDLMVDMVDVEDFYGYMDFKVTGTAEGVTAIQMDTKTKGLPLEVFKQGFVKSKVARLHILENMKGAIDAPRKEISPNAPRVHTMMIPVDKIGELIGPGGKNIKAMIERTSADFNIEDDGSVQIYAADNVVLGNAIKEIELITKEPEIGEVFDVKVVKVVDFGAFVEFMGGKQGLIHVSEISDEFVKDVNAVVKVGDTFKAKMIKVTPEGKLNLSRKGIN